MHPTDPRLNGIYGTIWFDELGDADGAGAPAQRHDLRRRRGRPVARAAPAPAPGSRVLAAEGRLPAGTVLRHDSIVGSTFTGTVLDTVDVGRAPRRRSPGHRHGLPHRRARLRRRPARPARPRVPAAMRFLDADGVAALGPAAAVQAITRRAARRARPRRGPAARAGRLSHGQFLLMPVGGGVGGRGQGRDRGAGQPAPRAAPHPGGLPAVRRRDAGAACGARRHRAHHAADAGRLGRGRAAAAARPGRCASPWSEPVPRRAATSRRCVAVRPSARVTLPRAGSRPGRRWTPSGSGRRTAEEALRTGDVVVCATSARSPLFDSGLLRDDVVVDRRRLPRAGRPRARRVAARGRATVVVEDVATALREAGDVVLAIAEGALDAADLLPMRDVVTGAVRLPAAGRWSSRASGCRGRTSSSPRPRSPQRTRPRGRSPRARLPERPQGLGCRTTSPTFHHGCSTASSPRRGALRTPSGPRSCWNARRTRRDSRRAAGAPPRGPAAAPGRTPR